MGTAGVWAAIGSIVSTGIAVVASIAVLVVALTVVRRQSTSAGGWMAAAAILWLVISIVAPIAYTGVSMLVSTTASGGPEAVVGANAMLGVGLSLLRACGWALLLVGVVRLARSAHESARKVVGLDGHASD